MWYSYLFDGQSCRLINQSINQSVSLFEERTHKTEEREKKRQKFANKKLSYLVVIGQRVWA